MSNLTTEIILSKEVNDFLAEFHENNKYNMYVVPKNSSKLMKSIGWFFSVTKINPHFMENYHTTIGSTVYIPDEILKDPSKQENLIRTLFHESIHVKDARKFSAAVFGFLYLFPQSLTVFSLFSFLAFWKIKFLWSLLFLLFALPIPAPFRYLFELRAYRTSISFARRQEKWNDEQMIPLYDWIIKQLTTSLYYFTWPFPSAIRKHLSDEWFMKTDDYKELNKWISIKNVLKVVRESK